jgi:hydroxyacylglutathione hydrolase
MDAWIAAGLPHATVPQISARKLQEALAENRMKVLDVRETSEWDDGHISGAQYMNFKVLRERAHELALAPTDAIAVTCATGKRSSTAASELRRQGFQHVYNLSGGMEAWQAAGLAVES